VELYEEIVNNLREGKRGVLCIVIRQLGSSPRGPGAKMVLFPGSVLGSVGGGRVEAEVLRAAEEVARSRIPKRLTFDLTGKDVLEMEAICGGKMEVLVEPLGEGDLEVFEALLDCLKVPRGAILLTGLPPDARGHLLAFEGKSVGGIEGVDLEALDSVLSSPPPDPVVLTVGEGQVYVEPIRRAPVLILFGAGHISQEVAPLAKRVGFEVVVVDDREEFANRERFPWADRIIVRDFERVGEGIPVDEDTYIVIVTRGHLHDYTVLKQYLRSPAKYIGMIGSRRKRSLIFQQLLREGFSREELARVHSPIGLEIGAETPQEIAVSIVGELIKVRRLGPCGPGRPPCRRGRVAFPPPQSPP